MEPTNEAAVMTAESTEGKKGIPGSTLKIIAIVTMFIDHFAAVILDSYLMKHGMAEINATNVTDQAAIQAAVDWMAQYGSIYYIDMFMRCIGRLAFPIFIFLLVEGFVHTHNRFKYALRLFIFALVSEIPFNLAFTGYALHEPETFGFQSVFWTLLAGFLFMCYAEFVKSKELPKIAYVATTVLSLALGGWLGMKGLTLLTSIATGLFKASVTVSNAIVFALTALGLVIFYIVWIKKKGLDELLKLTAVLSGLFFFMICAMYGNTDYNAWGVFAIGMAYFCKDMPKGRIIAPVIILTIMSFIEAFAFFDVLFVKNYNGKRGLKIKYFFYAFYPVHLFLFYTISWLMGNQHGAFFLGF